MKRIVLTLVIVALSNIVVAQNPTYTLDANDGWQSGSNIYEFDIDITWTNPGVVSQFEYAGGQYFFDFNTSIANGGILSYTFSSMDTSDLPSNLRPRNPTISGNQLRLAVNTIPLPGSGYIMPSSQQIRIVRMRLSTTAPEFALVPLNLTWRSQLPNPFTKIFAFINSVNTDISAPANHLINVVNDPMYPINVQFTSPQNNTISNSNFVYFSWNNFHSHDQTRLVIATDPILSNRIFDDSTIAHDSVSAFVRNAGVKLYAVLYSSLSGTVNGRSNQIIFSISENQEISYPISGDSLVLYNSTFKWRETPNSASYRLIIAEDSLFTIKKFDDSTVVDTFKIVNNLKHRQTYFWKVSAKDTGNVVSAISPVTKFRTVYPINLEVKCALQGMYNPLAGILNRKDSISVYLRRATSPFQIVDSAKVPIDTVSLVAYPGFKNATAGSYYVVVKHFNSIETWSKVGGLSLQTSGYPIPYDFTTSASQAYGNNMRLKGGKYCIYSGDVNQDGVIDGSDLSRIDNSAAFYQVGTRLPEDLDANGIVDADDFAIGDNNWYFITVITPMNMFDSENHYEESMQIIEP